MYFVFTIWFVLASTLIACKSNKKSEDSGAAQDAAVAAERPQKEEVTEEARELEVERDSEGALDAHLADIENFLELVRGDSEEPEYPDLANHAHTLLTHYHFDVMPHIRTQSFRLASFAWDRGELYAIRLTGAMGEASVSPEIAAAWDFYQTSRELLLLLKEEWGRY